MSNSVKLIPIPFSISELAPGTRVRYMCPICMKEIPNDQYKANVCPHCDVPLDWRNLPEHCSEEFKEKFETAKSRVAENGERKTNGERLVSMSDLMLDLYHKSIDAREDI